MSGFKAVLVAGSLILMGGTVAVSAFEGSREKRGSGNFEAERYSGQEMRERRRFRRAMLRRMLRMRLMRADANDDGEVTWAEVEAARGKFFDEFDLNKDGSITKQEIEERIRRRMERRVRAVSAWFDEDGDGKISKEEFNKPVKKRFERRDNNQDNKLSGSELPIRFLRLREMRQSFKNTHHDGDASDDTSKEDKREDKN